MEGGTDEVRLTRTIRDSVFRDLFSQEEYLLELYRALHPEDDNVHAADLEVVTIERVLTEGVYNDLGFTVGDRLVVLVEAQSRWSPNMTTRMLIYLAETYRRFLEKRGLTLHDSKLVAMPTPELYVIYTGDRKSVPEELSFARDVLGGATSSVELTVRVLRGGGDDIVGQYVASTQVYEEVRMMNESAAWKARCELS